MLTSRCFQCLDEVLFFYRGVGSIVSPPSLGGVWVSYRFSLRHQVVRCNTKCSLSVPNRLSVFPFDLHYSLLMLVMYHDPQICQVKRQTFFEIML